jgi:ribonuclease BN (tRNA processing enzyme)
MHADHFIDVIPLRYALRYGPRSRRAKLPVYLPPNGLAILKALVEALPREGGDFLADVFELAEYDPSQPLRIGGATVTFAPTTHYIPAFAMRWQHGTASATYSADTAPDERIVALARESDVFLCEATLRRGETEHGVRGHSSAEEAAAMARDAGVRRLVLTHYPQESTSVDLDRAARDIFGGEIVVADDHHTFEL